jgi:PAS domain S-box-containing protein
VSKGVEPGEALTRPRGWPRTIRSQLLGGLILLEVLSLLLFGALLLQRQAHDSYNRANQRLRHQANSLVVQVQEALSFNRLDAVRVATQMMSEAPSVATASISDPQGNVLYYGDGTPNRTESMRKPALLAGELAQVANIRPHEAKFFNLGDRSWECVQAIYLNGKLYGYAWVRTEKTWDREQLISTVESAAIFGAIWIAASILLAWGLARSITRPLAVLHRGTRALMLAPENHDQFPLPITVQNEVGDLIEAFNRMVASIDEQRAGLNDTLSLLDSMLANAPIGLAFFDRRSRFVRVNRIFADTTGIPLSRHLGRTLSEVLPLAVARQLEDTIEDVFTRDEAMRDLEVTGASELSGRPWTWITSAYPIHTAPNQVRWVGLIVMDASDRKRGEEALRKTEKLAATGRLAASIAHEINNPLEAITNLLYLLSTDAGLQEPARSYVEMAEHEVRRISEITQQTLRFYRQSTLPSRTDLSELLDSVLTLHQGRLRNLGIKVDRNYESSTDLYCFAGELRQVFANLIGNAIDAMPNGGRLCIRARRSRDWKNPDRVGVRFQISDTGYGMLPSVQKHIFEPFFTTKEITGTGLGLWVSSEIVVKHRGTMRVRSHSETLGGKSGTIFELFFPDADEPVQAQPAESQTVPVKA